MLLCKKIVLLLLAVSVLAGCRESLYTNLTEADANEMVLVLMNRGVDAKKESAGKAGFSVTVSEENLTRSLEIIKEHSLPRVKYQSLGTVFSGAGMISSQLEEQSRLAFAISQELSNTFSKIDGVLDARVHVVLLHNEQGTGTTTPPSASVFIRHVKDSPVVDMISGIKETTARAVPGLNLANVSVVLENFKENIVIPSSHRNKPDNSPMLYILVALGSILVTSLCFIVYGKIRNKKQSAPSSEETGK